MFLLLAAGVAYFFDAYRVALAFFGFSILENLLVVLRATINPTWVVQKRIEAGVDVDILRPGKHVFSLIATKVLLLWILAFFAYQVSLQAGLL